MLLAEAVSSDTSIALGLVITLVVLGGGVAAGVLTSRLMQGRSIRELQDDVKDINLWRSDATQQLRALITHNKIEAEVQKRLSDSTAAQSTARGTRPYTRARR